MATQVIEDINKSMETFGNAKKIRILRAMFGLQSADTSTEEIGWANLVTTALKEQDTRILPSALAHCNW